MRTKDYLDLAKRVLGVASDYALAKRLGVSQQAISKMRRGRVVMSNSTAAAMVLLLSELQLSKLLADLELERADRAKRADRRELWQRIRAAAALAVCAIGAATLGMPTASQTDGARFDITLFAAAVPIQHNPGRNTDCRQLLARVLAWLRGLL